MRVVARRVAPLAPSRSLSIAQQTRPQSLTCGYVSLYALSDDGTYDAAEIDREIMASRLQDDVLSHSPKIHLFPSTKLSRHPKTVFLPISTLPPTSARASSSTPHLYVSSKSGAISKYDIQTGALLAHFPRARKGKGKEKARDHYAQGGELEGHSDQVLDLAISEDGQWLASAGRDGIVGCWDVSGDGGKFVRGLRGHRDAVTVSLTLRLDFSVRRGEKLDANP